MGLIQPLAWESPYAAGEALKKGGEGDRMVQSVSLRNLLFFSRDFVCVCLEPPETDLCFWCF